MSISFSKILLDEICLEGLDGITVEGLWLRVENRLEHKVTSKLKNIFWHIIQHLKDIDFYLLPHSRPDLVIVNRFIKKDGKYFLNNIPEDQFSTSSIYPLHPVKNNFGSCQYYDIRINVNNEAKLLSLDEAMNKWGSKLVMVGTLQARWHALAPNSPPLFDVLNKAQYCILESIGRARYNGETTWKMMSAKGDPEDPKTLFYHRKILVQYSLVVKKQVCVKTSINTNTIIVHLSRFDFPFVTNEECAIKALTDAIQSSPNQMISLTKVKQVIKNVLDKNVSPKNFLKLTEVCKSIIIIKVPYKDLYPEATPEQCVKKSDGSPLYVRALKLIDKQQQPQNDNANEQDEDEMEINKEIVGHCYVGESLIHQAYNCVCEAGPTGVTRSMLSKMLGIDILTARTLLRRLQFRDNLKLILTEDKRQKKEYFVCPDFMKLRNDEFQKEQNKMDKMSKITQNVIPIPNHSSNMEKSSLKKIRLTNIILEQVRYRHIIHELSNLTKYCDRKQHALGVNTGVVDRRTILRIVKDLDQMGQLNYYKIKLEAKYNNKLLTFICEPNIKTDHPFIQSVIEQTKMSINSGDRGKQSSALMKSGASRKQSTCNNSNKFVKTCELHKFLFYIIYGHQNKVVDNIEKYSKYEEQFKDLTESEISSVYEDAPPGYCFVPPINKYSGWPEGWMLLADMFLSMPLHIFTGIISVPIFPLLDEYLKHPIKRQILLKNLPSEIQQAILWKKITIYPVVERLCFIGLLKFGQRVMKEKFRIFIYLNRLTTLLDTTTSGPSYHQIEDKNNYSEELFTFVNIDDVDRYWSRFKYICLNTMMGVQSSVVGKEITILSPEQKLGGYLISYEMTKAMEMDNGSIPGDRRGAAGLDSSLYTYLKRSWGVNDFNGKIATAPQSSVANFKEMSKLIGKKPKPLRNAQLVVGIPSAPRARGKIIKRTVMPRRKKKFHRGEIDAQDKLAATNMTTQRTYWSAKEDRIIYLTAIACNIITPKNLFSVAIRELLYRVTNVRDKTSSACRRRLLFLKKKKSSYRNMEIHLSEIKQNTNLMKQYLHLYKRLWVKENSSEYPNFLKEIQIHFIELVHYLHRMIFNKEVNSEYIALPATLNQLNSEFHIYSSEIPLSENYTEPTAIVDISHSKAQSVIHISLCSESKDNFSSKRHALKIFIQFNEDILRTEVLRINSLGIAVRNKNVKRKKHPASQLSSTYGLSQMYLYHLCSSTPYNIFSELYSHYKHIIQNTIKTIDCKSFDSGMAVLLTDLSSLGGLEMRLSIPKNILIPNPRLYANLDNTLCASMDSGISNLLNETTLATSSIQIVEEASGHSQDALVINTCQLKISLNCDIQMFFKTQDVSTILNKWISDATFEYDKESVYNISNLFQLSDHKILAEDLYNYIESNEIMGVPCADVKKRFSRHDKFLIQDILMILKDAKLIFRVGVKKLRLVSIKYFQTWFIKIKEPASSAVDLTNILKRKLEEADETKWKRLKFGEELDIIEYSIQKMCPENQDEEICNPLEETDSNLPSISSENIEETNDEDDFKSLYLNEDLDEVEVLHNTFMCARIWMKLDGSLNYRNLWRWMGAIMCYLVSHPIVSLENLCTRFHFLIPFHTYLLIEMLVDLRCVKLFTIKKSKISLWDDGVQSIIEDATMLDDFIDIHISIEDNALMRFSYIRGMAIDSKKCQDSTFLFEELLQSSVIQSQKTEDSKNEESLQV